MACWLPASAVKKLVGFSNPVPGQLFQKKEPWVRKTKSGRYEFNVEADGYLYWCKNYTQNKSKKNGPTEPVSKTQGVPKEHVQPEPIAAPAEETELSPAEKKRKDYMAQLRDEADEANLLLPTLNLQKKKIEVESKKIDFEKKAGNLLSSEDVDYAYFAYLEKLNMDVINCPKRLSTDIENLFKKNIIRNISIQSIDDEQTREALQAFLGDVDVKQMSLEFINSLMALLESIIINIKKSQAEELDRMQQEFQTVLLSL
jgi:hypothetical protein